MPRMPQKNNRLRTDKGETQKTKHDEDGDGNGDGNGEWGDAEHLSNV